MFERFELLIGDKINSIKNKNIILLGLGGVGSTCLLSLIRCGIENITIVDYDKVDITNLNRQIIAFRSNIGKYKTDVCESFIKDINPDVKVKKITRKIDSNNINYIIDNYDYIIDCIDDIKVKCELISIASKKDIRLISSMGTGNKMNPSKLKITDLSKTSYDPIARILRKYVKDNRLNKKVMVVCSDEEKYTKINKPIPSNSFVPTTAGLLITSYVINDIVGEKNV